MSQNVKQEVSRGMSSKKKAESNELVLLLLSTVAFGDNIRFEGDD